MQTPTVHQPASERTCIKVWCPNCDSEMSDLDDGWYCDEFWREGVLPAGWAHLHYLTYEEGQAQWDANAKADRDKLDQWLAWAGA